MLPGEEASCSVLTGEEASGSGLTTITDNILCPAVTQTKPEEHSDDDFIEVPPRVSKDSMLMHHSDTKLNGFIRFI